MNSFGKEALEAHNKFRAAHQAPPLTWSSALAQDAEVWAKKIAKKGRLEHDDTKDGENIYMVCGREIDGTDAVNSWYNEVKDYNFGKPGFQSNTGHFTQVVWKSSEELGIGRAKSADGKEFVVGRYKPAGNMMRAFAENVLPSKVREAGERYEHLIQKFVVLPLGFKFFLQVFNQAFPLLVHRQRDEALC